jgi:ParB family chromosome partitioning protein
MSKKLAAKAGLILGLPLPGVAAPAPVARPEQELQVAAMAGRPKTAPGSMLQFMSSQSAAIKEAEDLRDQLKAFDGATPVKLLPAQEVRASRWANRHAASFENTDFAELKTEIEAAGGNVQPIRVRPIGTVLNGSTPPPGQGDAARYEVVYGHRRHRACLELGLPVRALIEDASDQELFEAMERENRGRKNLSAWEQGCMYRQALDEGLYPSLRKLSEALQVDVSLVSKSVALARLPGAVVDAFPSPIEIQFRWAQPLGEALQKDPDGVIARAVQLKASGAGLAAAQVFEALVAPEAKALNGSTPQVMVLGRGQKKGATLSVDARGGVQLKFAPGVVSEQRRKELAKLIEEFLGA